MTPETTVSGCFDIGAVCRALVSTEPCGDAWTALHAGDLLTIVLADGVGHGQAAHEAATLAISTARAALEADPAAPLPAVMQACHAALRGTRGAALAVCRFDPARATTSYCGVGNTSLLCHPSPSGLGVSLPGIVGWKMRSVHVFDVALAQGDLYALHTDGVASSICLATYAGLSAQLAADKAMKEHGKISDDATVVAVRFRGASGASR